MSPSGVMHRCRHRAATHGLARSDQPGAVAEPPVTAGDRPRASTAPGCFLPARARGGRTAAGWAGPFSRCRDPRLPRPLPRGSTERSASPAPPPGGAAAPAGGAPAPAPSAEPPPPARRARPSPYRGHRRRCAAGSAGPCSRALRRIPDRTPDRTGPGLRAPRAVRSRPAPARSPRPPPAGARAGRHGAAVRRRGAARRVTRAEAAAHARRVAHGRAVSAPLACEGLFKSSKNQTRALPDGRRTGHSQRCWGRVTHPQWCCILGLLPQRKKNP